MTHKQNRTIKTKSNISDSEISLLTRLIDKLNKDNIHDKQLLQHLEQALQRDEYVCFRCNKVRMPDNVCVCDLRLEEDLA